MVDRSWKSDWETSTSLSKYALHTRDGTNMADTVPDGQNRVTGRCYRIRRSRRAPGFLLSRSGSQGSCLLANLTPLQGMKTCYSVLVRHNKINKPGRLADQANIAAFLLSRFATCVFSNHGSPPGGSTPCTTPTLTELKFIGTEEYRLSIYRRFPHGK